MSHSSGIQLADGLVEKFHEANASGAIRFLKAEIVDGLAPPRDTQSRSS